MHIYMYTYNVLCSTGGRFKTAGDGGSKTYFAPRWPPVGLVLNSMLSFDTSLGRMRAPGPHLIHSS
jgi:hypothetical protein